MKIAAAAYTPVWHQDWSALAAKLDAWVGEAAQAGASMAVFPEYAGIEAALIGTPDETMTPAQWRDAMAARADDWRALHVALAQAHQITLLAGSLCAAAPQGHVNRALLVGPDGVVGQQDKLIPTPYERDQMALVGGQTLSLFDTALGKIGILICYDSEFPLLARQLIAAGADMILVPSCTDFPAGQTRVRQSARARAIEGQCLVVQAPLTGKVVGCDVVDVSTGRAGVFVPPDHGMPPNGILAEGQTDVPGWTIVDVDPAAISAVRRTGQVGNAAHWPEQDRINSVVVQRL